MRPLRNGLLKLTIPFESIIKVEQTLDQQGNVKWANIRVADIIITTAQ